MSKIKIAICSVLKPVNDARMYEKFGISIAETGKYDVHIIGYSSAIPHHPYIHFYPLRPFRRISWNRFISPWKISKLLCKVKPQILIVNTHELLIVGLICKILFGSELLYDVQENYFRNIWYQNNFPPLIKHALAVTTRIKELIISPFLSYKILAEEKYQQELPFVEKNTVIILNKYQPLTPILPAKERTESEPWRFLFSGTIAEVYGIKEAITFYKAVKPIRSSTLTIIGHVTSIEIHRMIKMEAKADPDITINISPSPIDHQKIIATFPFINFALAPYHPNFSIDNCIPAKFYEYIAHNIPIIAPHHNDRWKSFLDQFDSAVYVDYRTILPEKIIQTLENQVFYKKGNFNSVLWKSESDKLLNVLANISTTIS